MCLTYVFNTCLTHKKHTCLTYVYSNMCLTHVKHMFNMCGPKHMFNMCGYFSCVHLNCTKNDRHMFIIFVLEAKLKK